MLTKIIIMQQLLIGVQSSCASYCDRSGVNSHSVTFIRLVSEQENIMNKGTRAFREEGYFPLVGRAGRYLWASTPAFISDRREGGQSSR